MRILLTGGTGQLGVAVAEAVARGNSQGAAQVELIAPGRDLLDLEDVDRAHDFVVAQRPTHLLHGGAWTAVDAAESEPARAAQVNEVSTRVLARAARAVGAEMLYVSTDFVFGAGHDRPIAVDAPPAPMNVYGQTKLGGERAVREILGDDALIVRTSWVYSTGGANFMKTMLRLMEERPSLRVVADQIGTPTAAETLAQASLELLRRGERGIWHVSDAGSASWYDFAVAIYEEARALGLLSAAVEIAPIPSEAYPVPAPRPRYSVLDKSKTWEAGVLTPVHWRQKLRETLAGV